MFLPVLDLPVGGPHHEPISVIYPPFSVNWSEALDRTISELTNNRLPPSRILLVCPDGRHTALVNEFRAQHQRLRERLRATSHVVVATYGPSGQVSNTMNLWDDGHEWTVTDDLVRTAAVKYIAALCNQTNALLTAPAGYEFQKPSGSSSSIFLRAGNMLREIDSVNVYSSMLLRKWPAEAKCIYVDSFTILSFAMAFQDIVRFFAGENTPGPSIENFHSYDKASRFSFPVEGDYLIVISASMSGDLARSLVESHGADESRIVHLIGAGPGAYEETFPKSCVYFHTLPATHRTVALDNIRIGGEEFLPSYGQPTRVSLTTKHIEPDDTRRYKDAFYQEHLKIQRSANTDGYNSYALFSVSNAACDLGPGDLDDWLTNRLVHEIPATTSLVVHLVDRMSKVLAERIVQKVPNLRHARVVAADTISQCKGKLSRENTILIVASEDPNMEGFVRVSTELRRWPDAHRHFVLAHAFPETKEGFDRIEKSLRMRSGDALPYGWSIFAVASVGRSDQHTRWLFDYPVDFVSAFGEPIDLHPLFDALQAYATGDSVFLPKLDGSRLRLRQGSVFFDGEYDELSDDAIYLAVTTAVQRAREGGGSGGRIPRFDSNPFVGSVIDPHMFSRYSDGILQAALLRCLHPSELDYSQSTVLSRHVRGLLITVLRNAANVVGEAALEFMAALAVNKISLTARDISVIHGQIERNAELAPIWKAFNTRTPI